MDILDRITLLLGNRDQKELTTFLHLNAVAYSEWKSGKSKSYRKYLIEIAEFFDVSLDYLVYGKEKSSPSSGLKEDEQELLAYYKELEPFKKGQLMERAKVLSEVSKTPVKQPEKAINTPKLQRAYMVSRSTDNTPPRFVEGDFSDILNAPDATDEY